MPSASERVCFVELIEAHRERLNTSQLSVDELNVYTQRQAVRLRPPRLQRCATA